MSQANAEFLQWFAAQTSEVQNDATLEVSRLLAAMVKRRRPLTPPATQQRFDPLHRPRQPPIRPPPPSNSQRPGFAQTTTSPPDTSYRISALADSPPPPSTSSNTQASASEYSQTSSTQQALDNLVLAPLQQRRLPTEDASSVDEDTLFRQLESFAGNRIRDDPFTHPSAVVLPLSLPTGYALPPPPALPTQAANGRFVTPPVYAPLPPPPSLAQVADVPSVPPPLLPTVYPRRMHQAPPVQQPRTRGLLRRISSKMRRNLPK